MRGEAALVHLVEAFTADELAACHLAGGALILAGTAVNQDGRSSSLTVRATYFLKLQVACVYMDKDATSCLLCNARGHLW